MKARTIALAVMATLILAFVATPPALAAGDFVPYVLVGAGTADVEEDTPLFVPSSEAP